MNLTLSYPTVRTAARRVIVKYGTEYKYFDHNDPGFLCKNINTIGVRGNTNGVGCIVGEIMRNLGVTIPPEGSIGGIQNHLFLGNTQVTLTKNAFNFLNRMQYEQDIGQTWGYAFTEAVIAHKGHNSK